MSAPAPLELRPHERPNRTELVVAAVEALVEELRRPVTSEEAVAAAGLVGRYAREAVGAAIRAGCVRVVGSTVDRGRRMNLLEPEP